MKILLVDDEYDITTSIKTGLQRKGFEVDGYTDPVEALANFKPNVYDLVLVDIRMPTMNGFEFYREIKKKTDNFKICFITAFEVYNEEFRKIFPNLDVQCFIRKPITIKDLIDHINSELKK